MPGLFDDKLTDKELIETKRQEAEEEIIAVPKVRISLDVDPLSSVMLTPC